MRIWKQTLMTALFIVAISGAAAATTTSIWKVSTPDDFNKGTFENTVLSSAGEVSLGLDLLRVGNDEVAVTCSVVDRTGALYVGTGNRGRILKLVGDKFEEYAATEGVYIASLVALDDGSLLAGSVFDATIYRIGADKTVTVFCKLPDQYVWAMALARDGTLYAGTGPEGKLFAIAQDGKFELIHDSRDDHILSIAIDPADNVYFGTYNSGLLCKYTKGKGVEVVADLDEQEIRTLVFAGNDLYIGANKVKKFEPGKFVRDLKKAAERKAEGEEVEVRLSDRYDGTIYRYSAAGFSVLFSMSKTCVYDIGVDGKGAVFVSTGDEGKIYKILPDGVNFVLCDLKEQQGMRLQFIGEELKYIGTGNTAAVYCVTSDTATKGAFISEVKDTRFRSRWGNISWSAKGRLTLQTRSGNTPTPDDTWSQWSAPMADSPAPITSAPGRYLQFKVNWEEDKTAVLSWVMVAFVMDNQQPHIKEVTVEGFDETGPFQGKAKETSELTVKWKAEDPDGDALVFRVFARRGLNEEWMLLTKDPTTKKDFKWDTAFFADGWYELRVEASDERSCPPGAQKTATHVVKPVLVDNHKPAIVALNVNKSLECTGVVEDSFSNIARLEYSLNGGEWTYIDSQDGVFDQRTESFKFQLDTLKKGAHFIAIRAYDSAGNIGARQEQFIVE